MSELGLSTLILATGEVSTRVQDERNYHHELTKLQPLCDELLANPGDNEHAEQQLRDTMIKIDSINSANADLQRVLRAAVAKLEEELKAARESDAVGADKDFQLREIKFAEVVLEDAQKSIRLLFP